MKDKELLKFYEFGWFCESKGFGINLPESFNNIFIKAFNLGKQDYIVGDEVKSIDAQTDEQILKKNKRRWK